MDTSGDDRVVALAGLFQATRQVHEVATSGAIQQRYFEVCIDSVFATDPDSTLACFGGDAEHLRLGLETLATELQQRIRTPALVRYLFALLHLEKKLRGDAEMLEEIGAGIAAIERQAQHLGRCHETVIRRLADLYLQTVSRMTPRVLVQGSPVYLQQERCVARIRALLLAGLRAAVLFAQLGGSRWQLLLRRKRFIREAEALLCGANRGSDLQ